MTYSGILKNGTFGRRELYFKEFYNPDSFDNYFFIHGAFDTTLKHKYFNIAKKLNEDRKVNVFLFETSRKIYTFENKLNYKNYANTFSGKSFKDEIKDVQILFKYYLEKIKKNSKNFQIKIIGFSLGGTLSSFLIRNFNKYISDIFLFGSGITTKRKDWPILNSYPTKESILNNFSQFSGNLFLILGSKDNVIPTDESVRIVLESKKAQLKELKILKGVDHRFRKINGALAERKLENIIYKILSKKVISAI